MTATKPEATGGDRVLAFIRKWIDTDGSEGVQRTCAKEINEIITFELSAQSAELEALRATVVRLNGALRQLLGAVNTCDFSFGRAQEWQTEEWITNGKQAAREALSLVLSDLADCVCVKRSEWGATVGMAHVQDDVIANNLIEIRNLKAELTALRSQGK